MTWQRMFHVKPAPPRLRWVATRPLLTSDGSTPPSRNYCLHRKQTLATGITNRNPSNLFGLLMSVMMPYLPNIPSSSRGTASSQKCPLGRTTPDKLRERRDSQPSVQAGSHTLHGSYRDSMKENGDVTGPNSAPPQVSRFHVKPGFARNESPTGIAREQVATPPRSEGPWSGRHSGLLMDSSGES